ncbi:MAG: hypothetical protein ABI635_00745 [Actinomycetota bacterium]
MRKLTTIGLAAAIVTLAACADQAPGAGQGEASATETATVAAPFGEGPPIDPAIWKEPLGPGATEIASEDGAELAFDPISPDGIGDANGIFVTAADEQTKLSERQIAWAFDIARFGGPLFVQEELVAGEAAQRELTGMGTASPGCTTVAPTEESPGELHCINEGFSLGKLSDGTEALLVEGPQATSVTWLEVATGVDDSSEVLGPAVMVMVVGPSLSFTTDRAIEAANAI